MRGLGSRLRSGLRPLAPRNFPYLRLGLALAIGGAGGWAFSRLGMPLPWLLGSMSTCTVAALMKAPMAAPRPVRPPMSAVIGVMLGAGFSAEIFAEIGSLGPTMLGLLLFLIVSGTVCTAYLRLVARFDLPTAYFAAMPGGLVDMVLLGEERGGDPRAIALAHAARIMLLVFTLPFLVQFLSGVDLGSRVQPGNSIFDAPWTSHLWLLATALCGAWIGKALRFPAGALTGPLTVSAAVHVSGVSGFQPSAEIINFAQLVLGTFVGCSFLGTPPRMVLRILLLSLGTTAILVALTIGFAVLVSRFSTYEPLPLILAYSPGGFAEMSLIALALRVEVAFVVAHHLARVLLVLVGAALVFRLFGASPKRK